VFASLATASLAAAQPAAFGASTVCPKGVTNAQYCESGSAQGTADHAATALEAALATLTSQSTRLRFSVLPSVGGELSFSVRVVDPIPPAHNPGPPGRVTVASGSGPITAGVPLSVNVPFLAIGQLILAYGKAHHIPIVAILTVTVDETAPNHVAHVTERVTVGGGAH
jgi:hypothetical protein